MFGRNSGKGLFEDGHIAPERLRIVVPSSLTERIPETHRSSFSESQRRKVIPGTWTPGENNGKKEDVP
jgi:hypothetical protein